MARTSGTSKKNSASKNTTRYNSGKGRKTNSANNQQTPRQRSEQERMISNELTLLIVFAVAVLLFLCNFGIIGPVGNGISGFLFGLFGLMAYIAPIFIFIAAAFGISNKGNRIAIMKLVASIVLLLCIGSLLHIFQGNLKETMGYSVSQLYKLGSESKLGGGVLGGSIAYLLYSLLDMTGSVVILIVLIIGCIVVITEKSFLNGVKKGSQYVVSTAKDDAQYRREKAELKREELRVQRDNRRKELETKKQEKLEQSVQEETEKILRKDKKVSGVMMDTKLTKKPPVKEVARRDNLHEITLADLEEQVDVTEKIAEPIVTEPAFDFHNIRIHGAHQIELEETEEFIVPEQVPINSGMKELQPSAEKEENSQERFEEISPSPVKLKRPVAKPVELTEKEKMMKAAGQDIKAMKEAEKQPARPYMFPPICSRL